MICWLVAFRVEIRRADVEILAIALAFFAAWAVCKTLPPFRAQSSIEIASKLAGAAGWALYVTRTSIALSRRPTA